MSRSRPDDAAPAPAFLADRPRSRRYLVMRREGAWFIAFDGEDYGPYQTEREAMLFAIDAAHKLGGQGEATEVLVQDENGEARSVWQYGDRPIPSSP